MRSEFSESWAVVGAEDIVELVEKDLIDDVVVFKRAGVEENKRVRRQAQLGNLTVRQTEMVGVV